MNSLKHRIFGHFEMPFSKLLFSATLLASLAISAPANAAIVSFLGSVDTGSPGMLGSLPRNFVLTLDYTPGGSGSPATATFLFPATPNADTPNPSTHPDFSVVSAGNLSVADNFMGSDIFTFGGFIPAGDIGSKDVNYSFSFLNPTDTIDAPIANSENIAKLINGQSTINFSGGGGAGVFTASGVIRGAPEPSTMIALTGLIAGGCGVGYRRKMNAKAKGEDSEKA